jgi:hypothetical protein
LWDREGTLNLVRKYGLGERGAVEYFAQRIQREANIKVPQRQTYLGMRAELKAGLEAGGVANYAALDRYVSLQDEYLDVLFPSHVKLRASGRARLHESDQFQRISDPDNKHYSGPTGVGNFDMDSVYWKSSWADGRRVAVAS